MNLDGELIFKTSRSGGAGGQNVNKVNTKVELNFHIANSQILTPEQKEILLKKLENKLTQEGMLQVISQSERSQLGNKKQAIKKFYAIITKALTVKKVRKASKPSKASKEKRLLTKKKRAEIKSWRSKNFE